MLRRAFVVVTLGIFLQVASARAARQVVPVAPKRIAGHVLPALARARKVRVASDTVSAEQPLSLTIVFNRDDPAAFQRFLADVRNPASPSFRHYLTPLQVSDRFGPSVADYDGVIGFLQRQGFAVTEMSPNRLTLVVKGTRGLAEKAFHLHLTDYELSGRHFFANDADPELPAELAARVQAITGLNSLARPSPTKDAILGAVCRFWGGAVGVATPEDPKNLYAQYEECLRQVTQCVNSCQINNFDFRTACTQFKHSGSIRANLVIGTPNAWKDVDGTGQKVGLVEFDSFALSDVSDYLDLLGMPSTQAGNISVVPINGGVSPGPDQDEVLLDIDAVLVVAPGASIAVYEAPFSGGAGFQAIFNRMINDHVTVASNSWSYCEDQTTMADAQSIDSVFQSAGASGMSVFNASGDTGSTCLDGAANTVGVPADSPNAIAVGGSSALAGPGATYLSETWWDGTSNVPITGQGGFGVSQFFGRPSYQDGFTSATGRSVPDVVSNSDPVDGVLICQESAGGCPSPNRYGGTSGAAPTWAAWAALLNQSFDGSMGVPNTLLYSLSAGDGFHSAGSLGSDFAHVGLGSPNVDLLHLAALAASPGAVDANQSQVQVVGVVTAADGSSAASVIVRVRDGNGDSVAGKTVTLAGNGGSHVDISPPSGVSTVANGAVVFSVTDSTIEDVTLTATADGVPVTQTAAPSFVAPAAVAGNVVASPTTVSADGTSTTNITVTLHDINNNGAVGKTVTLSQGAGRSTIGGPTPATTDSNGQVVFTATDTFTESVTYSAVDATDGNLPVPDTGTSTVSFTSGAGSGCLVGQLVPAAGWAVTSPVTGFALATNCVGVSGTAWDHDGNLWALNYPTGKLYKFPAAGGAANAATLIGTLPNTVPPEGLTSCPHGLTFSKDGQHLYVARQFCGSGGDVVEVSTTDASIVKSLTASDAIHCATGIATDPISGDLFVASPCQSADSLWRIENPESDSPTVSVYASPGRAIGMNFTPDGTLWTEVYPFGTGDHEIVKISGTNSGSPGTVTVLSANAPGNAGGVLPVFNPSTPGNPSFLFATNGNSGPGSVVKVDLTQNPPVITTIATGGIGELFVNGGPDGCAYVSNGDRVDRITAADGTCNFAPTSTAPMLSLSPGAASPAQGSSLTLTAQFFNVSIPIGTKIYFNVSGVNAGVLQGKTNSAGTASVTLTGQFAGTDLVTATTSVDGTAYVSNSATLAWSPGNHLTLLSLNSCPKSGTAGNLVTLQAGLFDVSEDPAVPVSGASIHFDLGDQSCDGSTDGAGVASCGITPASGGTFTLTASYAGSLAASARQPLVVGLSEPVPVFDPSSSTTSFSVKCGACLVLPLSNLFEGVAPSGQSTEPNGIIEPGETSAFSPRWANVSGAGFAGNAFTGDLSDPVLIGGTLTTPTSHAQYPNLAASADGFCTSCYSLGASFASGRPQVHVDATVLETPSIEGTPDAMDAHTWTIHIGNSFTDVPPSNIFYTYIETMVHNVVTLGVGGTSYGPLQTTPRNQMAAFIARADAHGDANVPTSGTVSGANNPAVHGPYDCESGGKSLFADVAPTDPFCKYIHYLVNLNVTIGCNTLDPPSYCQNTDVTRASMAVFISRAIRGARGFSNPDDAINDADSDGASRTYDCTNGPSPFLDVPLDSPPGTNPSCKNIGELWVMHVIDGDGAGHFLPNNEVSRQEMAKFIVNGERLSINNP